jgi:outer membrane lipoprotein carrier protein
VIRFVLLASFALPVSAIDAELGRLLESVEKRYNKARTLQVSFEETFSGAGPKRTESGELFLRKPGRMRWEYRTPAGKLFLSDGKDIYYYNPSSRRAEKMKLKESEDMRAPLAFLLGRLDFEKDFTNFRAVKQGLDTMVAATPKSDKLPYRQVEFVVTPEARIRELRVLGHDNSLLGFTFATEVMNPPLQDTLFKFELPPGAAWAEPVADGGAR